MKHHITIQPMHQPITQHVAETQRTFLHIIIFIGLIALTAFTAHQAVQIDKQISFASV